MKANDQKHKYVVYIKSDKLHNPVRFGDISMQHYKDKFKQYSDLDHGDKKRLQNFKSRFKAQYEKVKSDTGSALYWSWNYLW